MKKRWIAFLILCILLLGAGCSHMQTAAPLDDVRLLSVHVLDVGDADCILVQLPDGKNLLIDGGEAQTAEQVIAYLKNAGVEKLDAVLATHPHSDHIGGLPRILAVFPIDAVYFPNVVHTTKTYEKFLDAVEASGAAVTEAAAGVTVFEGAYTAQILSPIKGDNSNLNNYSAVLKLQYGEKTFLFGADAEKELEQELVEAYGNGLHSDVLKVCHHGSETSSTQAFLEAVSPEIALISAGGANEKYNNPNPSVVRRIEKTGVQILRTDLDGDLLLQTDGTDWIE